jgi:hypothetical protein
LNNEDLEDFEREGFGDSFFFIIQNPPILGELKLYWRRVYMNSSNSIYVVKILLKLKLY